MKAHFKQGLTPATQFPPAQRAHGKPPRLPVTAHAGAASIGARGRKTKPSNGSNASINKTLAGNMQPAHRADAGALVAAGVITKQ